MSFPLTGCVVDRRRGLAGSRRRRNRPPRRPIRFERLEDRSLLAGDLTTIVVSPASVSGVVGDAWLFSANGYDDEGQWMPIPEPTWHVNGGGTLSEVGGFHEFQATQAGDWTISCATTAVPGGVQGQAAIHVDPLQLAAITVSPASVSMEVGGQQQFMASGEDQKGNPFPISSPVWTTSGGGTITTENGTCTYTATAVGNFTVTCTQEGTTVQDTAEIATTNPPAQLTTIDVTPPNANLVVGQSTVFTATGKDQYGNTYPISSPVWRTSGGGTLSANGSACAYRATQAGVWEVTCSSPAIPGVKGTATVLVAGIALASNGKLQIVGTTGNDTVSLAPLTNNGLIVYATFLSGGIRIFRPGQVTTIEIYGGPGRDVILGTSLNTPLRIDGGEGNDLIRGGRAGDVLLGGLGNDTLWGGGGADVLLGGEGNDTLVGEAGRNLLIGGNGRDLLVSGPGEDILIGGRTTFSDPTPGAQVNQPALLAILAEWNSSRSSTLRRANLRDGSGSTVRLNDGFFLQLGSTLLDDSVSDNLLGSSRQDWYLWT